MAAIQAAALPKATVTNLDKFRRRSSENVKRNKKMRVMMVYNAASSLRDFVASKVPAGGRWAPYHRALKLGEIGGVPDAEPGFAAYIAKGEGLKKARDPETTLVFLKAFKKKKSSAKLRKLLAVLEQYGPWTLKTLPVVIDRTTMLVRYRIVKAAEVRRVALKNRKMAVQVARLLKRAGANVKKLDSEKKGPDGGAGLSEAERLAVALEFGGQFGGQNVDSLPAWRIGVARAQRVVLQGQKTKDQAARALADPDYYEWKTWPPKPDTVVPLQQVLSFSRFQKKVR
jgi:hypothetical protein